MIISEKQILQLINIAKQSLDFISPNELSDYRLYILDLLKKIDLQQSDELKEVKSD